MTTIKRLSLVKAKEMFLDVLRFAAEHLFFTFIILIFIAALLGSAVFYRHGILPQKSDPELNLQKAKFDEKSYRKVLDIWQSRGERLEAAETKKYPDLFRQ